MCRTQSEERYYDYPITTSATHHEYLYTTEYHPTSPEVPVVLEPEGNLSTQPTLQSHCGVSGDQLGMLLSNRTLPRYAASLTDVNWLGEQERAYICTQEFADDDILARFGLDLGTEPQVDGSSHTLALNIPPHLSEPSTADPSFPLSDATAQPSIEFDDTAYTQTLAEALEAPLPTNTGWEQDPQHISDVIDMSFLIPDVMSWRAWLETPANKELNGQGSASTELNAPSPDILVTALSPHLHLGPQGNTIDSSLTSLQPPQRPRARTAPTVFRDTTPNTPLSYPLGSPISVPPSTPHSLFGSECGSSPSTSPFSRSRDLPSYGNHPDSNINHRLRSSSVSTASRGRPLTRPRRMVERVLDPARVRLHISTHADVTQCSTSGGISSAPQHLGVPLFDWSCGGSDGSEYTPDSPSTPSNLSRASSTGSSVHRRPRSRSRSSNPYAKPSSSATAGDGTSSPEHPKSDKGRKYNGRDEFPGQRLHINESFLEGVLGDNPALRVLLDNILESSWRKEHIVEPNYRAENDDVSQGLDLPIERGTSVLLAFILRTGDEYTCVLCNEGLSTRAPRQLGHVRGHINLRPFPCEGCDSCDLKYVRCCLHSIVNVLTYHRCPARFFSRDLLQDHHRSSKLAKCTYWCVAPLGIDMHCV